MNNKKEKIMQLIVWLTRLLTGALVLAVNAWMILISRPANSVWATAIAIILAIVLDVKWAFTVFKK